MSKHQYGIPSGQQEGSQSRERGLVSPIEQYNSMQSHQLQTYGASHPAGSVARRPVGQSQRQDTGGTSYSGAPPPYQQNTSYESYRSQSSSSPDQDNYGAGAVGGGLIGITADIADSRPRESGVEAQRDIDNYYSGRRLNSLSPEPPYQSYDDPGRPMHQSSNSQSSIAPLAEHSADIAGHSSASSRFHQTSMPGYGYGYDQSMPGGRQPYQGDGYDEFLDPRDIADDGEDYGEPQRQRRSRFGGALAGGAGAGAAMKAFGARDASGNYGPVPGNGKNGAAEKSEWLKRQTGGKKRLRWIVGVIIAVILIAVVVGIVVGVLLKKNGNPTRGSADGSDGIWDINSSQVQAVLNNDNLHKVFPGMDYTPLNAQYPDCLSNPPYQNDVTLDVAVLAQMTPAIRLYGTDCKQTELVLKGIDLLGYNDTVKVWLGVWLGENSTTNTRQLEQMYDILDTYPEDHFAGVIVGNEVLFRKDLTLTQLANEISEVKSNLSKRGITLPVSTSDLGNDWTTSLAADSDIVMSNVHPFFAGVTPDKAAGWTWTFWQQHDAILKSENGAKYPTNIISETGWPSQGGNDCGPGVKCATKTAGSVAGIDELNEFMEGWVCPSMANGTTYFWFEAFDEPWKEMFDDPKTGDYWEPHWGLMDVNRNLKSGVKIPDCNGQTVDRAY